MFILKSQGRPVYGTPQYDANVLDSSTITAAPEPGTLALAGLGGLSLMLFRRGRK